MKMRSGEYHERGDYHKELDKNWPYYPVYLTKMAFVESFLDRFGKDKKILDAGCGEGLLVEQFCERGFDVSGIDMHYESEYVLRGNICATDYESGSFDMIMCLDVLEHLSYEDQEKAINEFHRILAPNGVLLITVPNLAHFASRVSFLLTGRLLRTSDARRHIGDRPITEYIDMITPQFQIDKRKGFFPTFPIISALTLLIPGRIVWMHRLYNAICAYPNWCFLNVIIARKK